MVETFARTTRQRIGLRNGGYRREHLRASARRVEVADRESPHHGIEVRTAAHLGRRLNRKIGGAWRSEFCL